MTVSTRLKILVDFEGSQAAFCRKTGIRTSTLATVISKGTGLRSGTIEDIARAYPNLNLNWLMAGKGTMWLDEVNPDPEAITQADLGEEGEGPGWARLVQLQEQRIKTLEREIKRDNPELAKELGIE